MKNGPLSSLLFSISLMLFITCNRSTEKRKIKLADEGTATRTDEQLTTTIHLEPTLRRAVAVMFFDNRTGDQNLEWLQKGLTEMFIRALSQSKNLSVLSTDRLQEILERLGKTTASDEIDVDMAAVVAQEANVEAILTGNISKIGDSLKIEVKVREPNEGQVLKEESIEGSGLENLFSMVDHLTQKIKDGLQISLDKDEADRGITELSTNSLEAWRHYTAGVDLTNNMLLSDAIEQFKNAIELDSTFVSSYLILCGLLYTQGEIQQGQEILQELLTLRDKATPQEKYQIDRLQAGVNNDTRRIIEVSRQWLQQYPDDRDANLNLAGLYYRIQDDDRALHYFKKALDIDPKYKSAYNFLGYIYARTGDYTNALTSLNKYKQLAPDEANPYDSIGEIYLFQGEYKKAEKNFKQATKLNDRAIFSWRNLGRTYIDKGEYKKALKILNTSLEKATDPTDKAEAHTWLGFTQWRLGRKDEAIINLKKSLQYRSTNYLVMTWLNEVYKDQNDHMSGIQSLKKNYDFLKNTIETYPTLLLLLTNLSLWYDMNTDETIRIIDRILKTTDNLTAQMWGRFLLTFLYLKTNQLDEYKKLSDDFPGEFMEIIKTVSDIPRPYSTWRNFSFFNQYAYEFIEEGIEKYNRLIDFCFDNGFKISEMVFRSLLADIYFHAGEREKATEQLIMSGIPEESKWWVIGPFDHKNGFNKKFPPEKDIRLSKFYKGKSQSMTWLRANDKLHDGYIDLQELLKQYNWSVGYGLIYVNSPEKKEVQLRVGTNDAAKIWLNDELVWKFNIGRDASFDDDIIRVSLNQGLNKILIKVCNQISLWGFYFRVTDEQGNGLPDIEFISADTINLLSI